jgi:hypothetical protein
MKLCRALQLLLLPGFTAKGLAYRLKATGFRANHSWPKWEGDGDGHWAACAKAKPITNCYQMAVLPNDDDYFGDDYDNSADKVGPGDKDERDEDDGHFFDNYSPTSFLTLAMRSESKQRHGSTQPVHVGIERLSKQLDAGDVILNNSNHHQTAPALNCYSGALAEHHGQTPHKGRKNIAWLHLHNFAGTFMCNEAKAQGEVVSDVNCNWCPDDCSAQKGSRVSCAKRGARDAQYTFSAQERDLDEDDFCSSVLKGVMLRDPLAGLTSTLHLNGYEKNRTLEILRTGEDKYVRHWGCIPLWDTYHHFDNFATRSLSGHYDEPPGGVTAEHLEAAKRNLERFDVVMILEELHEHVHQLSHFFGWDMSRIHSEKKVNPSSSKVDTSWTKDEQAFLRSINKFDYSLLAHGKELARQRSSAARAPK